MSATEVSIGDPRVWHDAEHSSYRADLDTYARIAARFEGPIVDLGAGTGRVSLELAARGHRVLAVEIDPLLATELRERAAHRSLPVEVITGDVRELALPETVSLILAPMQLVHILGGSAGRARLLAAVAGSLAPGGRFLAAMLGDELPSGRWRPDPVPDVREVSGWVHSSLATEIEVGEHEIVLRRLRQLVSPSGELSEQLSETVLDRFRAEELDREARAAGLRVSSTEPLPRSADHEDSLLLTFARADEEGTDG